MHQWIYTNFDSNKNKFPMKKKWKKIYTFFCKSTINKSISGIDRVDKSARPCVVEEAGWSRFDFTNYILYINNEIVKYIVDTEHQWMYTDSDS